MEEGSWLEVNEAHTLRFFFERLKDVTDDVQRPSDELLYNASVLAHYASTSTASTSAWLPAPGSLSTVFDVYLLDTSGHTDPLIMESAATQCLLFTGFFAAQQRRRHNLDWYASIGASFFVSAGQLHRDRRRAKMMWLMAEHFDFWRHAHAQLAEDLRTEPTLLLKPAA